jgi:hypothetical protein
MTADTEEDVLAASETNVKLASLTEHSIVAAVATNSPRNPVAASRKLNCFLTPPHCTVKEMVTGTDGPCAISFRNVPKSKVGTCRSVYSAVPAPRSISTLSDGIGTVQNRPFGTFPGSMEVT